MNTEPTRYIKMKEMIRLTGKSKSTLWRMYAKKTEFLKPGKTRSGSFLGWTEAEYEDWVKLQKG